MTAGTKNKPSSLESSHDPRILDPVALGNILIHVAERTQPILQNFFKDHGMDIDKDDLDPMHVQEAYIAFLQQLLSNPQKLLEMQTAFWQDRMHLWQDSALRFMGGEGKGLFKPKA